MLTKWIKLFSVVFMVFLLAACATEEVNKGTKASTPEPAINGEELLKEAKTVVIKEDAFSMKKKYGIFVGETKVAEVTGKYYKGFGDEFILKDVDGDILLKEKQVKRWGVKYERTAEIKNAKDEIIGYIGESVNTKLFSVGYFFHFFDKDKKEIGVSDQINFSLMKENKFLDNDENIDYYVKKQMAMTDEYELQIKDKENIPLEFAIIMVCIEDAIADAEAEE